MSPITATQIQLVPFSELAPGQAGVIRNKIIEAIVKEATERLRMPEDKLIVRDIRAKDDLVIYTGGSDGGIEDWAGVTEATANVYETMATGTVADRTWIGIYGVKADKDAFACTAIRFTIGGAEKVIWQLQALNEADDYVGLCPSGIIMPQNVIYTIERFNRYLSSPIRLVLKGVVVEPRGLVVSP